MTQVVIRGESVYECDTCKRRVRVPTNRRGLDIVQRCTITSNCQGKLHRVTAVKEINNTPAFPPEVEGLQDWFAREVLFTHQQPIRTTYWTVNHNLQNAPVVHVYVNRVVNGNSVLVESEPASMTIIDANTLLLTFKSAESGQAQCVSPSSKNTVNFNQTISTSSNTSVQLSSDTGEISIATLNSDTLVDITVEYATTQPVSIKYIGVDSSPSIRSPWTGVSTAIINGKKYTIRSFNLTLSQLAPSYFAGGFIPDGSSFYVDQINGVTTKATEVLFLLSNAPHSHVDRVYDKYIDTRQVDTTNPEVFYSAGKGYTASSVIKTTYPLILVV